MDFVRLIEPDNETHVIFQDYVNKLYNDIDSDINVLNIVWNENINFTHNKLKWKITFKFI